MQDPTNTLSKLKAKLKRQTFIVSQTLDEIKAYEAFLASRERPGDRSQVVFSPEGA